MLGLLGDAFGGIGRGLLAAGRGIGRGLDYGINRGMEGSLSSALGGQFDPSTLSEQQRRALKSQFLMNLGQGLRAGDLGAGIQGFQQQAAPAIQAGRTQTAIQSIMNAPGEPWQKYAKLGDIYAQLGQADKAKTYYDLSESLKPKAKRAFGEPIKGVDAQGKPAFFVRNEQNELTRLPDVTPAPEEMSPYQQVQVEQQKQQAALEAQKFMESQYQQNRTARNQTQSEEQLTARALAGDTNAQAILDAMQKRKVEIAGQSRPVIPQEETAPPDPISQDILSQTGLSLNAFRLLTGQGSQLPRDQVTRNRAAAEAGQFARKHGVDVSTLASQYGTYNKVLGFNLTRKNMATVQEQEIQGTIENLKAVTKDANLNRLNWSNVVKLWAGQQVNDPIAQQYAFHLEQLRNEVVAYNLIAQGQINADGSLKQGQDADVKRAENVIRNGVSSGSLDGLEAAVRNSTTKMSPILQRSVDTARKGVWGLFGVGANFRASTPGAAQQGAPPVGTIKSGYRFKGGNPADKNNWERVN